MMTVRGDTCILHFQYHTYDLAQNLFMTRCLVVNVRPNNSLKHGGSTLGYNITHTTSLAYT